ncbi:MAG TPA: YigZ family protein [Gemmatimonadaceae bacterium]|nr:YigZ family protein [Gemmatimonadaceae bacterium]
MRYPVPAASHRTTDVIQRSRFITTVERVGTVEAAEAFVRRIRAEFPDATHNCWAYVVGPPGSTGHVGMSDDGEPHNTAGRPMLTVLLHSGVGDVAAVVTRYYGGTKLGTGGLARAYSGGVQQALRELPLGERVELTRVRVTVDHASVSGLQRFLPDHEASVVGQEWGAEATFDVELPEERAEALRRAVGDLTRGRGTVASVD